LSFDERLGLLLDAERSERANYRYTPRLHWAKLPQQNDSLEDLDQRVPRGIDKRLIATLSTLQWIEQKLNLLII